MIVQFANIYLERLFQNKVSGKPKYNSEVILKFKRTILKLQYADTIKDVKSLKGLHFEALRGKLKGFYSVRVDYSYRLILTLDKSGQLTITNIITVHDLNNHYQ